MTSRPEKSDLRMFGLGLAFALTVISVSAKVRHPEVTWPIYPVGAAFLFLLSAAVVPVSILPVYLILHPVFRCVGWVLNTVLLSAFFFVVITPVAVVLKMAGRDPLNRRFSKDAASYWGDKAQAPDTVDAYLAGPNALLDLWQFLKDNQLWWMAPIVAALLLMGTIIITSGTAYAPFIYPF